MQRGREGGRERKEDEDSQNIEVQNPGEKRHDKDMTCEKELLRRTERRQLRQIEHFRQLGSVGQDVKSSG